MATDVYTGSLGHRRIAGASTGVSLSTTAAFTPIHKGTKYVKLLARNFSTAVVARYIECPYLVILKADSADGLLTPPVDQSELAQDGSTVAPLVDWSNLASGRFIYIGSMVPFRGASFDVAAPNSTGGTALTVRYWNGSSWTDLSVSDGTSGSLSLDQDGLASWTMPGAGAWKSASLKEISDALGNKIAEKFHGNAPFNTRTEKMYWTRWEWNANLDNAVTLNHILGANESTSYAAIDTVASSGPEEERVHHAPGITGIGGYEALTDAGTANLIINCYTLDGKFTHGAVR